MAARFSGSQQIPAMDSRFSASFSSPPACRTAVALRIDPVELHLLQGAALLDLPAESGELIVPGHQRQAPAHRLQGARPGLRSGPGAWRSPASPRDTPGPGTRRSPHNAGPPPSGRSTSGRRRSDSTRSRSRPPPPLVPRRASTGQLCNSSHSRRCCCRHRRTTGPRSRSPRACSSVNSP